MNRLLLLFLLLSFSKVTLNGQACFPDGLTFSNQQQIDSFFVVNPDCSIIEGNLTVRTTSSIFNFKGLKNIKEIKGDFDIQIFSDIEDFSGLDSLTKIGGSFQIKLATDLNSFKGLEQLREIGGRMIIDECDELLDFTGLNNLQSIGQDLLIEENEQLISFDGLNQLTEVGQKMIIENNPKLADLNGLNALQDVGGLIEIQRNLSLQSLNSFNNIDSLPGGLSIQGNTSLTAINGFERLENVGATFIILFNESLENLTGFQQLKSVKDFKINQNGKVNSLENFANLETVNGSFTIFSANTIKNLKGFEKIDTIQGFLRIVGNDNMENLEGLQNLKYVGGYLSILVNNNLKNLEHLQQLTHINGGLYLRENKSLATLNGLENIPSMQGQLWITENEVLDDISAIANLDPKAITDLLIENNPVLSICEEKSICEFINMASDSLAIIQNNATGCNNLEEIQTACTIRNAPLTPYQPLVIENATWIQVSTTDVYAETVDYFAYKIQGDSTINGTTYKKLFSYTLAFLSNNKYQLLTSNFRLLIREDTVERKVYAFPTVNVYGETLFQEYLLYDFSKRVGQNIEYREYEITKITKITDEKNQLWFGENRRTLFTDEGFTLIEGIGFQNGLLETPKPIITPVGGGVIIDHCIGTNFSCNLLTNTNEPLRQKISIFPNPTSNVINLQFNQTLSATLSLKTITGQTINQARMKGISHQIDVTTLPKGLYFLHVQSEEGFQMKKIIVQ